MARKKQTVVDIYDTKFSREYSVEVNGFTIEKGEIIKIHGEYGAKFKFVALVTNTETGAQWIDCLEIERGQFAGWRSFYVERIKRIPKKRGKNVSRRAASTAS
jgi:hypothetical protein